MNAVDAVQQSLVALIASAPLVFGTAMSSIPAVAGTLDLTSTSTDTAASTEVLILDVDHLLALQARDPICSEHPDVCTLLAGALSTAARVEAPSPQSEALHDITLAQAEAGLFVAALGTAESIPDFGLHLSALRGVARYQALAGLFADAEALATQIPDSRIKARTLTDIACAQIAAELMDQARQSFLAALATHDLGAIGVPVGDELLWDGGGSRERGLRDIAVAHVEVGLIDHARQLFADAHEAALAIRDVSGRSAALIEIADAQVEAGLQADALDTLAAVQPAADHFTYLLTSTVTGRAWAQAGNPDQARQAFADALQAAARFAATHVDAHQSDVAKDIFTAALRNLARAQTEAGWIADAIETAEAGAALVGGDNQRRVQILLQVAESLLEVGRPDDSRQFLTDTLESMMTVADESERILAMLDIARAMNQAGWREDAHGIALWVAQAQWPPYGDMGRLDILNMAGEVIPPWQGYLVIALEDVETIETLFTEARGRDVQPAFWTAAPTTRAVMNMLSGRAFAIARSVDLSAELQFVEGFFAEAVLYGRLISDPERRATALGLIASSQADAALTLLRAPSLTEQ